MDPETNLLNHLLQRRRDLLRLHENQPPTDGSPPPVSTLWPLAMLLSRRSAPSRLSRTPFGVRVAASPTSLRAA